MLIVEDEESIRKFISVNLKRNSFEPIEASTGEEALLKLSQKVPSVVVLDVMLPGIDGFEVLRKIREKELDTAVIMLTARGQDMDKIMGLEFGADDYMVKPFNPLELIARIRAVLRRTVKNRDEKITQGNLCLDLMAQKFLKNGVQIELTPREYSVVKILMTKRGNALSRDELLNAVWGERYFGDIKTVDVHIRRIREKVEDDPSSPRIIETVWGYGYRWRPG